MGIKGVDLSIHNKRVNFNELVKQGIKFVILRIGYRGYVTGEIVKDEMFEEFFSLAKQHGLGVGVYFFTQAINENEAIEEANFIIEQIGGRKLEYPVYIDQEYSNDNKNGRADYNSNTTNTDVIKAFCNTLEKQKYYAGVYCSESWFESKVFKKQLTKYDKWIAKWSIYKPSTTRLEILECGKTQTICL